MPPRSHMLLLLDVDGRRYVVDAGFGGVTLTGPLHLEADVEQTTPHEPFRLVKAGDEFIEQVKIGGHWVSLYRCNLSEQFLPDYDRTRRNSTQPWRGSWDQAQIDHKSCGRRAIPFLRKRTGLKPADPREGSHDD